MELAKIKRFVFHCKLPAMIYLVYVIKYIELKHVLVSFCRALQGMYLCRSESNYYVEYANGIDAFGLNVLWVCMNSLAHVVQ